jgi:hypothetical protein
MPGVEIAGPLPAGASVRWFRNGQVLGGFDSALFALIPIPATASGLFHAEITVSGLSARTQARFALKKTCARHPDER